MSERVETLRWELRVRREREQQHGETVSGKRMIAALTAAIEALEGRGWKDAPDGDGLYWVRFPGDEDDRPTLANVHADGEEAMCSLWLEGGECMYTLRSLAEDGLLWSRLPDPPPVPNEEPQQAVEQCVRCKGAAVQHCEEEYGFVCGNPLCATCRCICRGQRDLPTVPESEGGNE